MAASGENSAKQSEIQENIIIYKIVKILYDETKQDSSFKSLLHCHMSLTKLSNSTVVESDFLKVG